MDIVLRAAAVYGLVWVVFRVAGRRTLSEMTSFDFVLLLIVSESVQQALMDHDSSITAAAIALATLVGLDVALSLVSQRWPNVEHVLDGVPVVIVRDGKPLEELMKEFRVGEDDVLEESRRRFGISDMADIDVAVLERTGHISIIPRRKGRAD